MSKADQRPLNFSLLPLDAPQLANALPREAGSCLAEAAAATRDKRHRPSRRQGTFGHPNQMKGCRTRPATFCVVAVRGRCGARVGGYFSF